MSVESTIDSGEWKAKSREWTVDSGWWTEDSGECRLKSRVDTNEWTHVLLV